MRIRLFSQCGSESRSRSGRVGTSYIFFCTKAERFLVNKARAIFYIGTVPSISGGFGTGFMFFCTVRFPVPGIPNDVDPVPDPRLLFLRLSVPYQTVEM